MINPENCSDWSFDKLYAFAVGNSIIDVNNAEYDRENMKDYPEWLISIVQKHLNKECGIKDIDTVILSCEEAIDGTWDHAHDEGGFEAMITLLQRAKELLK